MAKPKIDKDHAFDEDRAIGPSGQKWKRESALEQIQDSLEVKEKLANECLDQIIQMADVISDTLRKGRKVAFFGNGGSAADAQHIVAELVGKFTATRPPLRALALTTNTSALTAVGNDFGFDEIFARQVDALIDEGDVVVGISTSGKSKNVIKGIEQARRQGAKTIALTGTPGRPLIDNCDNHVTVPSSNTQRIQEAHILIGHIVCGLVEASMQESHGVR